LLSARKTENIFMPAPIDPYRYDHRHLGALSELSYTPDKLMELLEEAILLLVSLLRYEPSQREAVAEIHRALYELCHALRKTRPM
jgi:hypothetical protein